MSVQNHSFFRRPAVVMVCGSLKGMAPDVDAVIVQLLGQDGHDRLLAEGRYRRDVY